MWNQHLSLYTPSSQRPKLNCKNIRILQTMLKPNGGVDKV